MALMRKVVFMIVVLLRVATAFAAQQTPAAKPQVATMLAGLHAAKWTDRAEAYEELRDDPMAIPKPEVQSALLELLNRENQLTELTLRDSHEKVGVSEKYGEGFGEYVDELGDTVDTFANWNDPRQVCIFVHEAYNPESKFAAKIASHAKLATPCLIEMYRSEVGLVRAEAAGVLVQAVAKAQDQLDRNTIGMAIQLIGRALRDPDDAVRSTSVRALSKFAGPDMIPALEQVAQSDPSPEVHGHSIRKSALDAINAIQKRAQQ